MLSLLVKQKIMYVLVAVALLITLFVGFRTSLVSAESAESSKDAVCQGLGAVTGSNGTCEDPAGADTIDSTIEGAINMISLAVGVISVIMIIIGGIKYVTSQGESGSVSSAKNTIIYAIIGLIIVALSQTVVKFVIAKLS